LSLNKDHIPDSNADKAMNLLGSNPPEENAPFSKWDDKETFIKRAFEDDPAKGCELLFKQYYQPLCSHAVRYVYSKEIAHDLVSELFCFFWQNKLYLDIKISFRAYLFVSVRNRALKHLRKEFGRSENPIDITEQNYPSALPSPHDIMQHAELSHQLEKAIQTLKVQTQKIFLMNRFEGKKYHEIGKELKISIKTVEAHMSKALYSLRRAVLDDDIF
jgi:RNA polymerase sigma-70 factor (family 1)